MSDASSDNAASQAVAAAPSEASSLPTPTTEVQPPTDRKPGELYPPIEPYNTGWLTVSDIHEIYYEECGNKDGNPVVYL